MKLIHLPLLAMTLGVCLVAFSFLWPRIVGTGMVWSEEEAHELSEAAAEMHRLVHEHGHAAPEAGANHEEDEPEVLRAARQRYQRSEAGLRRARSLRQGPAAVFKWTGIVLALLGAGGYFVVRSLGE